MLLIIWIRKRLVVVKIRLVTYYLEMLVVTSEQDVTDAITNESK